MGKKRNQHLLPLGLLLFLGMLFSMFSQAYAEPKAFDYLLPQSDSHRYTEDEIADMSVQVLCYAKNEIYARHGRKFQSKELTAYFEEQPWYQGTIEPSKFSETVFNDYEMYNVEFLTKREKELQKGGYLLDQAGYSFDEVYDYLYASASDTGIGDGLTYDKTAHTMSSPWFALSIPETWIGRWSYIVSNDSIYFCCKSVRANKDEYDGILCTIYRTRVYYDPVEEFPSADYFGATNGYYYYLLYPTDVRFNPDDSRSASDYGDMFEHVSELFYSFILYGE